MELKSKRRNADVRDIRRENALQTMVRDGRLPFDQLKAPAQTSQNFSKSIHVLKPDADAEAEIKKAAEQYIDDMEESQVGS